jgi:hypothetical protein
MAAYRREYDEKIRELKTILKKPKVTKKVARFEQEIVQRTNDKIEFEKAKRANGEIVLEF